MTSTCAAGRAPSLAPKTCAAMGGIGLQAVAASCAVFPCVLDSPDPVLRRLCTMDGYMHCG
jgi:hypothetical protein